MTRIPGRRYRESVSLCEPVEKFPDRASARRRFEGTLWPIGRNCGASPLRRYGSGPGRTSDALRIPLFALPPIVIALADDDSAPPLHLLQSARRRFGIYGAERTGRERLRRAAPELLAQRIGMECETPMKNAGRAS